MSLKRVYLDHSATTPARPEVVKYLEPFFAGIFGNPSSIHHFGQEARKHVEDAREKVARLLNAAGSDEIFFTSGGTESDNMAVKGTAFANRAQGDHLITTSIEHHAVLSTCEFLEKQGFSVTYLPVDRFGRVSPDQVASAVTDRTILVSVMHANNEVGTIQPLAEIGTLLARLNAERRAHGRPHIYFHTDAVQTAGKLPVDVQALGVDLLSLSAHKFYGPKGSGALYIRHGTIIEPVLHGGHHERNLRAGTENVPGIMGLSRALELAAADIPQERPHLARLRDRLEKGILQAVPGTTVNGHPGERLESIANISFKYVEGEALLVSLDLAGIAVSTGSACASGAVGASHVLKAMCVDPVAAQGTIRFSLGRSTSDEDIDHVLKVLPPIVHRLSEMSPLKK